MRHTKVFNGETYYWRGGTTCQLDALLSHDRLVRKDDLVILERGRSPDHPEDQTIYWNIWRRPAIRTYVSKPQC